MALVVETTAGRIEGRAKNDVLLFAGIPLRSGTVGDLRFAAPAPHAGWTDVRDATRSARWHPQACRRHESCWPVPASRPQWSGGLPVPQRADPALDDGRTAR